MNYIKELMKELSATHEGINDSKENLFNQLHELGIENE